MSQIFKPRSNFFAKVSIFGALFFIAGLSLVLVTFFRSPYITRVGIPIEQPVPFSHQLHVSGVGVDCRYCHTSVEESSFAGLPTTHTCMTCHSQILPDSPALVLLHSSFRSGNPIEWNRVNDIADFTYFKHNIHIQKGIGCESCHGRVDQMPLVMKTETLYMEFCLKCHRNPEEFVRPREEVYTMGWEPAEDQRQLGERLVAEYEIRPANKLDDCSLCHY